MVKQQKIIWIDSLKGIAMCAVILVHIGIGEYKTNLDFVDLVVSNGMLGVQVFL